jgi:hypothetical protein
MSFISFRFKVGLRSMAGGGGVILRFVCGYMICDPHLSWPILNGLPSVFKVNLRAHRSGYWQESSILHLVDEAASASVGRESHAGSVLEILAYGHTCSATLQACRE